MKFLKDKNKYPAYTLLEMLVVMSIFIILGGMTFSSFDGLQNTIKMNEYMLNLEQDIRNVQRSAMLLQRSSGEKWIYGLGIDFSDMGEDGVYKVFKWCSPYEDYGDNVATKSNVPAYNSSISGGEIGFSNGYLPVGEIPTLNFCNLGVIDGEDQTGYLRTIAGYDRSITLPKSQIILGNGDASDAKYILFESVSGRAFFYDSVGALKNYVAGGKIIDDPNAILDFKITITPLGKGSTRDLSVRNLSGKIDTNINE